ncbi:hypothetical protein UPYG_G00115960 [Umbra pygmaea]|uniref:SH24A n=1 Tax=Umbra pygmaea TaxID=75934 RepID=A0ABD0XL97_UMBPY
MLQQILKDMYIDPDVLEALNDDQKKTLFLKMRQEQVRRWKEHEENETERRPKPKTSTANRKNVSWLLGRDGDVAVMVIGEVDEMKTSRLICAGPVEKRTPPSLLNNSSHQINPVKGNLVDRADPEPVRTGRDNLPPKAQPVTQLNLKENGEEVKTVPPLEVTVTESQQTAEAELRQELDVEDTEEEPVLLSYRPHPRVNDSTLSPLKINSPPSPCP